MSTTLLTAPATALARMIRDDEVSSVEVVQAHLDRIAAVNGALNALVQFSPSALDEARAADQALARGAPAGPFHGVPFTVKDWIETEGLVCAAGFAERADYRPKRDAPVVARMRHAGAILLGKTTVNQGVPYPRPNNPFDLARTPGASSSGEAAIVAAGGSPMGLASDSGGSIRWPAHCCGVAALKPTTGLVPNTGHSPRLGHLSDPRTTIGPMARSAADLFPVLRVIAGEDPGDPGAVPVPLGDPEAVRMRGLRVGWFVEMPGATPSAETVATVRAAAEALAALGAAVSEAAPPDLERSWPITQAYWKRVSSLSHNRWAPPWPSRLSADEIEEATFDWERFARTMAGFMQGYDLLVSPVAAQPAHRHGAGEGNEYHYTLPWSLTRQPAAVVRFGTSPEGLPIGVQLIARTWRDHIAVAAALALEEAAPQWPASPHWQTASSL